MTVAIRQVQVPREHRFVATGQTVRLQIQVINQTLSSGLVIATEAPLITLYDPDDVVLVRDAEMSTAALGTYFYDYQTTMASPLGVYTANFTALYDSHYARIEKIAVFKVTRGSTFTVLSYFAIKDQTHVIWYWWILIDGTIETSLIPPAYPMKNNTVLNSVIPYWLQMDNPVPLTKYVYPEITGDILVAASAPAVGAGTATVYTFIAYNGKSYQLRLDIANQLYALEV